MKTSETKAVAPSKGTIDRLAGLGFFAGLGGIVFLAGMIVSIAQMPPYRTVRDAWIGFSAVCAQQNLLSGKFPAYLWTPTGRAEKGVAQHDQGQANAGYTVYTSTHDGGAVLVDNQGEEVYRWEIPFRKIWPHPRHVPSWVPDHFVHIRKAHVYPNGDLLAVYSTTANTPSGCGLARVDRHSQTLWTFDDNAHHDFDIASDGTIFALTHRVQHVGDDEKLASLSNVPLIEDLVVLVTPEGKEIKRFSILEAVVSSPYFRPLLCHVDRFGDITHNNTIDVIGEEFAAHYDEISAGDVMVCLRNLGLMAVLNAESEQIVWATTGPWNHPHDPDPLINGNILVFDNYQVRGTEHGSAVVEFDPRTRAVVWSYDGTAERPIRSDIRGRQQLLPGGNVLITDSDNGRLLEVTRAGDIAWEFLNPVRGGEQNDLIPVVCGGHRYSAEEVPFLSGEESSPSDMSVAQTVSPR